MRTTVAALLASAILLTSCRTVPPPLPKLVPDSKTGVLVGRSIVVRNGKHVNADNVRSFLGFEVRSELYQFEGSDKVPFRTGSALFDLLGNRDMKKYVFTTRGRLGGYYVLALPPGRYFFGQHTYSGYTPSKFNLLNIATFDTPRNGDRKSRYFVVFEIKAGKATYAGTMQHNLDYESGPTNWFSWGLNAIDETGLAKEWVRTNQPQLEPFLETNLAVEISVEDPREQR
ncbi:MAG TPA: hypothetical protein VK629_05260 [Steroidobacteraceae bacterium]|nr:hypothetical protein [Steroidobacteraceae bacterium]